MRSLRSASLLLLALLASCGGGSPGTDAAIDAPGAGRPRWERYIRGDVDTRLVIELDYVAGAEPRAAAEADLLARLGSLLDKPGGITIVRGDVIASRGADHAWTFAELTALADETFDGDGAAGTVAMHVMWLDGHSAEDTASGSVLGQAWSLTHIAMFHDTIESACSGHPILGDQVCAETQYGVWAHEVGHTIGLVDNGLPMVTPHADAAHGAHDDDPECLMYFAFDSSAGLDLIRDSLLGGGGAPDFDPSCLEDVAAVRAR
jgi:hypothetical protein